MDMKAAIVAGAVIAMGVLAIVLGRVQRKWTPREHRTANLGAAAFMCVAMICMSVAWPQMWGPVGSWTWIAVVLVVIYGFVRMWRRFIKDAPYLDNPVNPPARNPDAPAEGN